MRSPFRAKHHVVVQYTARWMKCPLAPPPPPTPHPWIPLPLDPLAPDPPALDPKPCGQHDLWKTQGGQGRIEDIATKGLRTAVALSTASCSRGEIVTEPQNSLECWVTVGMRDSNGLLKPSHDNSSEHLFCSQMSAKCTRFSTYPLGNTF